MWYCYGFLDCQTTNQSFQSQLVKFMFNILLLFKSISSIVTSQHNIFTQHKQDPLKSMRRHM